MGLLVNILIVLVVLLPSVACATVIFEDGFENGFAQGWYGRFDTFQTTNRNAYTGTFAATTNGVRDVWIAADLGSSQSGTFFDCWFFDSMARNEEHMIGVSTVDPCCGTQRILWIGLESYFDGSQYMYGEGWEEYATPVYRSRGWHKASFFTDGTTTILSLDDQTLANVSFEAGWRYIVLWENGKYESHVTNYWDDVKVYTDFPVPALPTTWGSIKAMYK